MQIKPTMTYHLTLIRMSIINKQQVLVRISWKGNPRALLVGLQTGAATVENSIEFPQKLKPALPYDPGIPLLEIYSKKTETLVLKNTRSPMFTAALFTIARIWKQSKCPSVMSR